MMLDNFGVAEDKWRDTVRIKPGNSGPTAPADSRFLSRDIWDALWRRWPPILRELAEPKGSQLRSARNRIWLHRPRWLRAPDITTEVRESGLPGNLDDQR
jgi:hypothetical protein